MANFVIVVAGGSGTRMQNLVPKQFLPLHGLPILMHTLLAFEQSKLPLSTLLVLNPQVIPLWRQLCEQHVFSSPYTLVEGGETRFHSVLNGLNFLRNQRLPAEENYIAIHDGVRPLVSSNLIERGFTEVKKLGAVIPAVPSKDSVRIKQQALTPSKSLDRNHIFLVQTPQFFSSEILFEAYRQPYTDAFTDDASVVEKSGHPIHLMEGDVRNLKITYQEDLWQAEAILRSVRAPH